MSEDSKSSGTLPPSEPEHLSPSQTAPHTAADKLQEVTTRYNQLVHLAELSQQRYNVLHDDVHHINTTIHRFARRIPDRGGNQNKVTDAIDRYSQATGGLAEQLSEDMVTEREKWSGFVKEAHMVKSQISDLKNLVAAEKRTAEKKGGGLQHEMVEDVDAAEDESPAEEENDAGARLSLKLLSQ